MQGRFLNVGFVQVSKDLKETMESPGHLEQLDQRENKVPMEKTATTVLMVPMELRDLKERPQLGPRETRVTRE